MKAKLFLTVMLNCCFCLSAVSQVTMFGGKDCGQWVANSKSDSAMKWWLLGFMLVSVLEFPMLKMTHLKRLILPSKSFFVDG
jgi:hypothetical protein